MATHCLDATYQWQQLSIILSAAQTTEDEVHQVQDIACSLVGRGFFSMAFGGQQISAYPIQAKTTLNQYAGGSRKPNKCWGCGKEDHPWCKGKGPIVCPMKANPACIKRAEDNHRSLSKIDAHAAVAILATSLMPITLPMLVNLNLPSIRM